MCSVVRCDPLLDRLIAQRIARGVSGGADEALCPGTIDTPMVSDRLDKGMLKMDALLRDLPMKRLGKAEEIADAVLVLGEHNGT
jgi:hypothetical protein